jgi:hypothetical protein
MMYVVIESDLVIRVGRMLQYLSLDPHFGNMPQPWGLTHVYSSGNW